MMAVGLRRVPSQAESADFRGREYFDQDLYDQLSLVGMVTYAPGTIASDAVDTFTVTVTGARPNQQQQVVVGPPANLDSDLGFDAVVTDNDEVTVRVHNRGGCGIDPGSAIWGVRVLR